MINSRDASEHVESCSFSYLCRRILDNLYRCINVSVSTGCNILADLGIHDIDYLVWMTHARRPESVYVSGHAHDLAMKDARECDILLTQIKYPDGLLAILDTCRVSSYGYDIRAEVG